MAARRAGAERVLAVGVDVGGPRVLLSQPGVTSVVTNVADGGWRDALRWDADDAREEGGGPPALWLAPQLVDRLLARERLSPEAVAVTVAVPTWLDLATRHHLVERVVGSSAAWRPTEVVCVGTPVCLVAGHVAGRGPLAAAVLGVDADVGWSASVVVADADGCVREVAAVGAGPDGPVDRAALLARLVADAAEAGLGRIELLVVTGPPREDERVLAALAATAPAWGPADVRVAATRLTIGAGAVELARELHRAPHLITTCLPRDLRVTMPDGSATLAPAGTPLPCRVTLDGASADVQLLIEEDGVGPTLRTWAGEGGRGPAELVVRIGADAGVQLGAAGGAPWSVGWSEPAVALLDDAPREGALVRRSAGGPRALRAADGAPALAVAAGAVAVAAGAAAAGAAATAPPSPAAGAVAVATVAAVPAAPGGERPPEPPAPPAPPRPTATHPRVHAPGPGPFAVMAAALWRSERLLGMELGELVALRSLPALVDRPDDAADHLLRQGLARLASGASAIGGPLGQALGDAAEAGAAVLEAQPAHRYVGGTATDVRDEIARVVEHLAVVVGVVSAAERRRLVRDAMLLGPDPSTAAAIVDDVLASAGLTLAAGGAPGVAASAGARVAGAWWDGTAWHVGDPHAGGEAGEPDGPAGAAGAVVRVRVLLER